jgi:STE24 endopeptidase
MVMDISPDVERQKMASEYARISRRLDFAELFIAAILLFVLIFGGLSAELSRHLPATQPWASAVYFIILILGFGIITVPISYYRGFVLAHRYGLSIQKFRSWLIDKSKASIISIVLGLIIIIFAYWRLDYSPDTWWLWTGIFILVLSLLLARITPTLLISLFFKLEPIEDSELEKKLINLTERAGAKVCGVFTINLSSKSNTANAMLAGLGKTRRIIISDTMITQYSPQEVEVVLAHELGHHIHRDIMKMIIVQVVTALLAFYLTHLVLTVSISLLAIENIADPAAFPLLVLSLAFFSLIMMPAANAFSRYLEKIADMTSLELTDNPLAFITAMTKLTDQNLSEAQPSRWVELLFYDHPPYTRRVNMARSYIKRNNKEVSDSTHFN